MEGVGIPTTHSQDHLDRLDRFLRQAKAIVAAFDQDPVQKQGDDGWPVDVDAYGWAAHRRDRSLWDAFLPVQIHAGDLLGTATAQLDQIPEESRKAWSPKIAALERAVDTLETEHDRLMDRLRDHLVRSRPNLAAVDLMVTEFFDEAWPALDVWASGGHAVIDLNTTVHQGAAPSRTPKPALRLVSGGIIPPGAPGRSRGGHR
ncbi:hypothetical protein [Streptomyces jumonjinensis]|uniref:hypothetical protein n=1 Tax=Streptomyces jumonjinensis TaxID=1945 RepID=UPI00378FEBB7